MKQHRLSTVIFSLAALALASVPAVWAGDKANDGWTQAGGPNGSWTVDKVPSPPVHWSVARDQNIVWRTTLPEEGQSGITISGNRLFLTTMKPLADDKTSKEGHDVVGYCLDAKTGKILWTVDVPGTANSTYAYGFSDSTTPTPIADGEHVYFFNSSGAICACDYAGTVVWTRTWKPTEGRPFNKQYKPILVGDMLINMEPRDMDDPLRQTKDPWNYLRGLDRKTGKTLWVSEDALTHYNTPAYSRLSDGTPAILEARGGYHDVPESPAGLSMVSLAPANAGKTLWHFDTPGGKSLYTMHWDRKYAYWFDQDNGLHLVLDSASGKLLRTQSLTQSVDYRRWDAATGQYVLESGVDLSMRPQGTFKVFPGWFTNIPVRGWDYFLCFTDPGSKTGPPYCVGRVNIESGKVEYLELPVQVVRDPNLPDKFVWNQPQTTSTVDSRGINAAGDRRSQRDGWYWNFLGAPTAVDGNIYFTTMLGVTYVIDGHAAVLNEKALLAVNDLGLAGKTWSLNSISYSGGRLYHRSMREVVCIGEKH